MILTLGLKNRFSYKILSEEITLLFLKKKSIENGIKVLKLSDCLYFSSLKEIEGQQAAVLSYIDPLVSVLVSVFILKEEITFVQIIGGALILIFTLLNELKLKKLKD